MPSVGPPITSDRQNERLIFIVRFLDRRLISSRLRLPAILNPDKQPLALKSLAKSAFRVKTARCGTFSVPRIQVNCAENYPEKIRRDASGYHPPTRR